MLRVAVIADDLTGAADTGIQFFRQEAPVYLLGCENLGSFRFPGSPHSLSVFTHTRNLRGGEAIERVRAVASTIKDRNPLLIYKKIDSCLRGNMGVELDAVAEALGSEASFVAPAFPAQNRITLHDVHSLHGVPLAETEMAHDPVSPVAESRVSVLLGRQSRLPVGRIDLDVLERGAGHLFREVERFVRQGFHHIVFDAVTQAHLDAIASLALTRFPRSLLAGSAGLASSLSRLLAPGTVGTRVMPRPLGKRILFVCGSASGILGAQVEELVRRSGCASYCLDPRELIERHRRETLLRLSRSAARELSGRGVVLNVKPPTGSTPPSDGQEILKGLVEIVVSALDAVRPDAIFLSGGDTAFAVLNALQAEGILMAREIVSGLVLGTFIGGPFHCLPVTTKAGAFGAPDTLVRLYETLSGGKDPNNGRRP